MKTCSSCKIKKSLIEFNKNKSQPDGHHNQCKLCRATYSRQDYQARKEIYQKRGKTWRSINKEKISIKSRIWKTNNRELVNKQARDWRANNVDKARASVNKYQQNNKDVAKTYRIKNADHIKETRAIYLSKHPEQLVANSVALTVSVSLKPAILKRDNYKCQLCENKHNLIIHHIIPKAKDLTLVMEQSNLITLCKSCHKDKAHNGNFRLLNETIAEQLKQIIRINV